MSTQYSLLPLALTAILTAAPVLSAGPRGMQPAQPLLSALDESESASLTFMHEEEKVARDVYLAMDEHWQALPFANIALAEQKHMETLKSMMDRYNLVDLSDPNAGSFTDTDLQALYDKVTVEGKVSYLAALQVGALIEEVDIEDLENAIAATDNLDLQTAYGNLLRGSRNHLRAFATQIELQQVEGYEAQHLDQGAVDAILDTPMERGGNGGGQNNGGKRLGMTDTGAERFLERGGNGGGKGQGTGQGQGKGKGTGQGLNHEAHC
jgi:hypothetical protein